MGESCCGILNAEEVPGCFDGVHQLDHQGIDRGCTASFAGCSHDGTIEGVYFAGLTTANALKGRPGVGRAAHASAHREGHQLA